VTRADPKDGGWWCRWTTPTSRNVPNAAGWLSTPHPRIIRT